MDFSLIVGFIFILQHVFSNLVMVAECKVLSSSAAIVLNKHPKLVVFSFDGFRHDYMGKVETSTLDLLKSSGVSADYMNPQFMTKTFVNHQSFVTGLYAESHGIVDNVVFDPDFNRSLSGFGSGDDEFWNFHNNVVPIWILNERAGDGRISGVQFPGADKAYGGPNASLPTHYLSYENDTVRPYEQRMDIVYSWLTNETHPANLVFMYFDQPDSAGHAFGPNSEQVLEQVRRMDNITKYLIDKLEAAGILEQINFLFWSDHGMEEVTIARRINVTKLVLEEGKIDRNMYTEYGGTPVLQIAPVEGSETQVYKAFKHASEGWNFTVYNKSEIPDRLHYRNNRRIMDILVIADPGYVFQDYRFWDNTSNQTFGVHGYDNAVMSMKPFFIANGPLFKQNHTIAPFDSIDLFPLIANMMKFAPAPNNGTLAHVDGIRREETGSGAASRNVPISWFTINWIFTCLVIVARDIYEIGHRIL